MPTAFDPTAWVHHSPSPALALDAQGCVTAANDAIARCLACEPRQLIATELAGWAVDPAALRDFLRACRGSSCEFRLRAGDGNERHVELSLGRIGDHRLLSAFDVTGRRAAEEKTQQENQRFRDIVGVGGGTLYEINAALTQIRLWQRDMTDGSPKIRETSAKFPDDVIDPTYNLEGIAETNRCYAAREPIRNFIYRVPRQDGAEVYRLGNSVPFYDNDGNYLGRRGVSIEVTAWVLAERALRESEAQLRRAREHLEHAQRAAATGSSERDLATGALEWSEEMYRLVGVDRASFALTDANMFGLVHEEDRERLKATIVMGRRGIRPPPAEFRIRRQDCEIRTLYCETDVIHDNTGRAVRVLTVFKDVTELRTAENRQKEIEQQLLHAQKLEALGTLAGGVAHELNNTLVPVLALAKLTMKRLPDGGRDHNNLTTILRASERARDLIGQILAFSRNDTPARCSVDVAELVSEAMRMLRASVPSTIHIDEMIASAPPVVADPGQLHQIVTNLVNNAVQAIGYRLGTITVAVAAASSEELAGDAPLRQGPFIRLSVSDTGSGMDEATQARIFEPFFTTKAVGQGTGLGLSVVHGIVTQHGGHIAVRSRVGQGARFDVFLPAVETARPEARQCVAI